MTIPISFFASGTERRYMMKTIPISTSAETLALLLLILLWFS